MLGRMLEGIGAEVEGICAIVEVGRRVDRGRDKLVEVDRRGVIRGRDVSNAQGAVEGVFDNPEGQVVLGYETDVNLPVLRTENTIDRQVLVDDARDVELKGSILERAEVGAPFTADQESRTHPEINIEGG